MSAPSPGLLAALEREARAQGVWMVRGDEFKLAGWTMATGEAVEHYTLVGQRPPLGSVGIVRAVEGWPGAGDRWMVEPLTAALWLLARRSGLTVRVGACTACDGPCPDCDAPGDTSCVMCDGTADLGCAVCSDGERATGIERRPLHEVLLAARPHECCTNGLELAGHGDVRDCSVCGGCGPDHETRDRLVVFADGLLAAGNPIGGLLSLWLAGKLRDGHVLGVETMTDLAVEERVVARQSALWLGDDGWEWVKPISHTRADRMQRPTLEARPT